MRAGCCFAVALLLVAALSAQTPLIRVPRVFHASTEVVSVTVTVRDRDGHLITDLPREAFDVREDGEPQVVTQFTRDRVPVSLAVLLDTSDSMFGARLQDARDAVDDFATNLIDPSDEFALVTFNHQMHVSMDWSAAPPAVHEPLQRVRSSGSTALYDAIVAALPLADNRHRERAAFLVISDGADTASESRLRDVQSALNRSDVFVYAVAIDAPERRAINTSVDPVALATITDQSGGRTETVKGTGALAGSLARIAEELNSQYVLGYSPVHRSDGQYHTIRVRIVAHPEYRVQARRGYIANPGVERGR